VGTWTADPWGAPSPSSGPGGAGTPSGLFYGGSLTTLGNKMRTNGVSNQGTYSGLDGAEHFMPQAGTLTRVTIFRTNDTSDVDFSLLVGGASVATFKVLAGNKSQGFDVSVAAADMEGVAIEYAATAGSSPDFTTGVVWWTA